MLIERQDAWGRAIVAAASIGKLKKDIPLALPGELVIARPGDDAELTRETSRPDPGAIRGFFARHFGG